MIELTELIEYIDLKIEKAGGLSQSRHIFWGELELHFHNGFRKEQYEVRNTIKQSKGGKDESNS